MSDHEVAASGPAAAAPVETGNARVDAVVRSLDSLEGRRVEEHVAIFDAAHRELREALSDSDQPA